MDYLLDVYETSIEITFRPGDFFGSLKDPDIDGPLKYLATVAVVNAFFLGILLSSQQGFQAFLRTSLFLYLVSLVTPLLSAVFIQLFSLALNGEGDYEDSFAALAYGYTPTALFGWIPVVGVLANLYAFYLYILGISSQQGISKWRALAVLLLPGFVFLGILLVVMGVLAVVVSAGTAGTLTGASLPAAYPSIGLLAP